MDNCLASNSETGGVGCDNMTMVIIGLLQGKTKEEWYKMIGERVANGDGPCAPPEYAEFRGPGMHHSFDDSPDDYDMDMDQRTRMLGRHDHDGDVDMDERGEAEEDSSEEKDEEQVRKDQAKSNDDRGQREQTPGPSTTEVTQKVEEAAQRLFGSDSTKPEDPTTSVPVDASATKEQQSATK